MSAAVPTLWLVALASAATTNPSGVGADQAVECRAKQAEPQIVAVLDSGVDVRAKHLAAYKIQVIDLTGEGPRDLSGHGTAVTSLLLGGLSSRPIKAIHVKILDRNNKTDDVKILKGLQIALEHGATIVNLSAGVRLPRARALAACRKFRKLARRYPQSLMVVAAGNEGIALGLPSESTVLVPQECSRSTANRTDGGAIDPVDLQEMVDDIGWLAQQGKVSDAEDLVRELAKDEPTLRSCCPDLHRRAARLSALLIALSMYHDESLPEERERILIDAKELTDPPLNLSEVASAVWKRITAMELNERGLKNFNEKRTAQAIADLTAAIDRDPGCGEFYNNRIATWLVRGDLAKALADCKQATSLEPNLAVAHNHCGIVHSRRGDDAAAMASYSTAIKLRPDYAAALFNRGEILLRQGHIDQAIRDFTQSIKHNANVGQTYYRRGLAHQRLGKLEGAASDFEKALKLGIPEAKDALGSLRAGHK
jgi:tetratricopeptide (TPR) repeat protein